MHPDEIATALEIVSDGDGDGDGHGHAPATPAPAEDDDLGEFDADLGELDSYLVALLETRNEDDLDDDVEFDDPTEIALLQDVGIDLDDGDETPYAPGEIPGAHDRPGAGFEMLEPDPEESADDGVAA